MYILEPGRWPHFRSSLYSTLHNCDDGVSCFLLLIVGTHYITHRTTSPALDDTPVALSPNPLPNPDPTPPTPAPGTNNDDPNTYVDKLFRHWAKNSRLAFLNSHLATYREHVNRGKSQATDYVYEVVEEYFKRYHWKMKILDEPSENNPLQMESDESLSPIELMQKSQKVLAMQKVGVFTCIYWYISQHSSRRSRAG